MVLCGSGTLGRILPFLVSSEQTQPVAPGSLGYLSSFLPNNPLSETLKKVVDIFDEVR